MEYDDDEEVILHKNFPKFSLSLIYHNMWYKNCVGFNFCSFCEFSFIHKIHDFKWCYCVIVLMQ